MITKVYNLATNEILTFVLDGEEALISAYLLNSDRSSLIDEHEVREAARSLITKGHKSMAIGCFACLISVNNPILSDTPA